MNLLKAIAAASHRGVSSPTDPLWANVVFMSNFQGTNGSTTFVDEKAGKTMTAAGDAQLDTSFKLNGVSSLKLDGTGDYVTIGASADFNFGGADDFCVEAWVWVDSTDYGGAIYCMNPRNHYVGFVGSATTYTGNGIINSNVANFSSSANQWTHVAHVRLNNIHTLYFGGVAVNTSAFTTQSFGSSTSVPLLGRDPSYGESKMWMNGIRVTKGQARYTANFTPPSGLFPAS